MNMNGTNAVLRVDRIGMDAILAILGYPPADRMDKWNWKDFDAEADVFVEIETLNDVEAEMKGERVYNKPLQYERGTTDDMYDDWCDYVCNLPEGTKTALTSEDGIRIGFETEQQRRC